MDDFNQGNNFDYDDDSISDNISEIKDSYSDLKQKIKDRGKSKNVNHHNSSAKDGGKAFRENIRATNSSNAGTASANGVANGATAGSGSAAASGNAAGGAAASGGAAAAGGAAAGGTAAGVSATGYGAIIVAAIALVMAIRNLIKNLDKKIAEKSGDTVENVKAKRRIVLFGGIIVVFFIVFLIASALFVVSDTAYDDLAQLIKRREERYGKSLIMFTDSEYDETMSKDYKDDKSYSTILKEYGNDMAYSFLPGLTEVADINKDENLSEKEKQEKIVNLGIDVVKKYLKAERENFNKINWNTSNARNQYNYTRNQHYSSESAYQNDSSGMPQLTSNAANVSGGSINSGDKFYWELYKEYNTGAKYEIKDEKGKGTGLKIPETVLEGEEDKNEAAKYYVDFLKDYLQKWVIPYTMMIDSQDKEFIDRVMDEMYHRVDVNVYKLSKETKNTQKQYYMKAKKTIMTQRYVIYTDDTSNAHMVLPNTIHTQEEETNTKDDKLGAGSTHARVISNNYENNGRKGTLYEETSVYVELDPSMQKATDESGNPLVKEINVQRDVSAYKNAPKVTNIESFYDIIREKYKIRQINESDPPNASSSNSNVNSSDGILTETLTETWYEELEQVGQTEKSVYKVSYYTDEQLENLDRKISRVEWAQDYGIGVKKSSKDNGIVQLEKGGESGKVEINGINYKLYDQTKFKGNIPAAGSGITCETTILSGYKKDFNLNPNGLAKQLNWKSITSLSSISSDLKKNNVNTEVNDWKLNSNPDNIKKTTKEKIKNNLKQKKPVIALLQPTCPYTKKTSHFVALLDINNNDEITVFNPNGGKTTTDSLDKIVEYITSGSGKSEKGYILITSNAEKAADSEKDKKGQVSEENSNKLTEMLKKGMELESQIPYTFDNSVHSSVDAMLGHGTDCAGFAISMYQIYFAPAFDYSYFASQGFSVFSIFSTCESVDKDGIKGQKVFDGGGGTTWNDEIASIIKPGDVVYTSGHITLYAGDIKGDGNLYVLSHGGGASGTVPGPTIHTAESYYTGCPILGIIRFVGDAEITGTAGSAGSQMYPPKTSKEKEDAKKKYGDGKGYSYDDLYFAYYHIEQYYQELNEVNGHSTDTSSGYGLGWPVDIQKYPGCEIINCFYGYTPAYGSAHSGTDISAGSGYVTGSTLHVGPEVIAAHDGTVTVATANPSSDAAEYTYVQIKNEEGTIETQYGHLSKIMVKVGQKVKKGDVIGKMGTTGRSTGTHLHFAIFENGSRTDPMNHYILAKVGSDEEVDYSKIDKNSITSLPTGYKFLREKGGGSQALVDFIAGWEGCTPISSDGKKYQITIDPVAGTRAVGPGIDLDAGGYDSALRKAGYSTSVGSWVDKDFIDKLAVDQINNRFRNAVVSRTQGLNLKEHQIDALTSRAYNMGEEGALGSMYTSMNFNDSYKKYWKKSDFSSSVNYNHPLYTNYMQYVTNGGLLGLVKRRKSEWVLFQTGVYDSSH